MNKITILDRAQFDAIVNKLINSSSINHDVVYNIYLTASEGIQGLAEENVLEVPTVNPLELVY